jgi:hypothetical protein
MNCIYQFTLQNFLQDESTQIVKQNVFLLNSSLDLYQII